MRGAHHGIRPTADFLHDFARDNKRLQSENSNLKEIIDKLSSDVNALREELKVQQTTHETTIGELTNALNVAVSDKTEAEQTLQDAKTELTELHAAMIAAAEHMEAKDKQMAETIGTIEKLNNEVAKKEGEFGNIREQLSKALATAAELQATKENTTTSVGELTDELEQCRQRMEEMSSRHQRERETLLAAHSTAVAALEARIARMEAEAAERAALPFTEIEVAKAEIRLLRETAEDAKAATMAAQRELDVLRIRESSQKAAVEDASAARRALAVLAGRVRAANGRLQLAEARDSTVAQLLGTSSFSGDADGFVPAAPTGSGESADGLEGVPLAFFERLPGVLARYERVVEILTAERAQHSREKTTAAASDDTVAALRETATANIERRKLAEQRLKDATDHLHTTARALAAAEEAVGVQAARADAAEGEIGRLHNVAALHGELMAQQQELLEDFAAGRPPPVTVAAQRLDAINVLKHALLECQQEQLPQPPQAPRTRSGSAAAHYGGTRPTAAPGGGALAGGPFGRACARGCDGGVPNANGPDGSPSHFAHAHHPSHSPRAKAYAAQQMRAGVARGLVPPRPPPPHEAPPSDPRATRVVRLAQQGARGTDLAQALQRRGSAASAAGAAADAIDVLLGFGGGGGGGGRGRGHDARHGEEYGYVYDAVRGGGGGRSDDTAPPAPAPAAGGRGDVNAPLLTNEPITRASMEALKAQAKAVIAAGRGGADYVPAGDFVGMSRMR